MKILVVGCGAAGATAAQFARKANRTAEIVLVGYDAHGEYSRCGLPYVLSGRIGGFERLVEYPPEWFRRFGVAVKPDTEVTSIDFERHTASAVPLHTGGAEVLEYDSLVLATGATAKMPRIPGLSPMDRTLSERVFTLRTIEDARRIDEALQCAASCLIVGAGLIGMELAEAMCLRSGSDRFRTVMVDVAPQALATMVDPDMAAIVSESLVERGIDFLGGTSVTHISGGENCRVECRSAAGQTSCVVVDLVIMAVGSGPNASLGQSGGCAVGPTGGLIVDDHCRTSVAGVYAAGDCTEYRDFVTGRPVSAGTGGVAVRQGRVAGINAAGGDDSISEGLLNSRATRVFGLEVAGVGPTTLQLREAGIEPLVGKIGGSTRPSYFPGGKRITAKLLGHPYDARLLGAQIVAEEGAHLRADVLGTAILNRMTAGRFTQMEMCYAPPISPTLDCIAVAADAVHMRCEKSNQIRRTPSDERRRD